LLQIQSELHEEKLEHEGKTAEQVYAERLAQLTITGGEYDDGPPVVRALLARCLLWLEIVQDKCVGLYMTAPYQAMLTQTWTQTRQD